jgi:recombinational DNA repair protein (RecF pathway)
MGRQQQSVEAIVLASHEARADRVITLLSDEHGRFPAFAKGAMGSKRRFGAHVEPMTRSTVELSVGGSGMARLLSASTVEAHAALKADLLRFALASTMCEVVLHLVVEHGREEGVYPLVKRALAHLNRPEIEVSEDLLLLFELKMLARSGVLGSLESLPLGEEILAVILDWNEGQWRPLHKEGRRDLALYLETRIQETSGRALRSRHFLDQMIDEAV